MKVLIEKYRGFDINFDTNNAKFTCLVDDENLKSSTSYPAMKKYIDDYLKDNNTFAPFWIETDPKNGYSYNKYQVIGIAKDKGLITIDAEGNKGKLSKYSESDYVVSDPINDGHINELHKLKKQYDEYRYNYGKSRKEILSRMETVNLKDYKNELTKEN